MLIISTNRTLAIPKQMELATDNHHLIPGQQRQGWDALSGGASESPEVPMALPLNENRPGFLSPLPGATHSECYRPPLPPTVTVPEAVPLAARVQTQVERAVQDDSSGAQVERAVQDDSSGAQAERAVQQDECALLNIAAMLLAASRSEGLDNQAWNFTNQCHQDHLKPLLSSPEMEKVIDRMLECRNGSYRSQSRTPCLLVAAARSFNAIEPRIRTWKDFDISGLRAQAESGPSLTTCAQMVLQYEDWPEECKFEEHGLLQMDAGCACGATLKVPNLEPTTYQEEGEEDYTIPPISFLERDSRGLVMGSYCLRGFGRPCAQVRITHIPSNYTTPFRLDQLVTEHHRDRDNFTSIPPSDYSCFEMHAVKCTGSTRSLRPMQGVSNGDVAKVTALQGKTLLQINKDTPLNLACQSVAIMRLRGMDPPPPPSTPYQMYEMQGEGVWFNNLIEVLVNDQPVFATMTTPDNIRGAED